MINFWLDAQLPPGLARWINESFDGCDATPLCDLGLATASDPRIYDEAARANAVVVSKDRDFVRLWHERRPMARIVLLDCGNTTNQRLRRILEPVLPGIIERLEAGETFINVVTDAA